MKPAKSWQPVYRFGGNPASWMVPAPLGTRHGYHYGPLNKGKAKRSKSRG